MTTAVRDTPTTFGPRDLDSFISTLRRASRLTSDSSKIELLSAAASLRGSLESWEGAIARQGVPVPAPSEAAVFAPAGDEGQSAPNKSQIVHDVRHIDSMLSRLILRHSNFGFAVANNPSTLDRHFPGGDALREIRVGRRHLRAALPALDETASPAKER